MVLQFNDDIFSNQQYKMYEFIQLHSLYWMRVAAIYAGIESALGYLIYRVVTLAV